MPTGFAPSIISNSCRDIGRHFSVNRMLAAESYRMRLETGLNFIEFNYMLLQAYDFLYLVKNHGCLLQMGGNDQWGNIVAGIDLIRRVDGKQAYGITFPLITTASRAQDGEDRERDRLAGRRPHVPLRVLPVLGQRGRRRRGSGSWPSLPICPWRRSGR